MIRERLIIVSEVERKRHKDWSSVIEKIRRNVTAEHDLPPDAIVLVRFGSMPKTSSGKIQRRACRTDFLNEQLQIVAQWSSWHEDNAPVATAQIPAESNGEDLIDVDQRVAQEVLDHVRSVAKERAKRLTLDSNIVLDLGLDSLERLQIAHSLEETFNGRIPEEVVHQLETCREVAAAIEKYIGTEPKIRRRFQDGKPSKSVGEIPSENYKFADIPEYRRLKQAEALLSSTNLSNPYFSVHQSITNDRTTIGGQELISFSSYNYLGMSGDEHVSEAAKRAIDQFGTSVSASRLVSGEKTVHRELERGLASFIGTADADLHGRRSRYQ